MGRHSLGMSPGDFGNLRSAADGGEGTLPSSSVRAFRLSGGGMGFIFRPEDDLPAPPVVGDVVLDVSADPEEEAADGGESDFLMLRSSGLSWTGGAAAEVEASGGDGDAFIVGGVAEIRGMRGGGERCRASILWSIGSLRGGAHVGASWNIEGLKVYRSGVSVCGRLLIAPSDLTAIN